jgi:cysteine desulfurase
MENRKIYLDHAATTPLDEDVLQKMLPYFRDCFGNADSPHALGRRAMGAVDLARDSVATLIHAKPSEVFFTSGGTESDNWAMRIGAYAKKWQGRTEIAVSTIEHHAVIESAKKLESEGFVIRWIPVNEGGMVALNDVKACINEKTALVAVMAVNNETGAVQPIREIAHLAHENGSLFFTDAVQAAPYMPLDVREIGADLLSFSSHKFYGPKGCGVLYVKSGIKAERLIVGGEQEKGLRGGTTNVPAVVGFSAAYEKNVATMSASNEKIAKLRALFLQEIADLDGVWINGDQDGLPAVLNIRFLGVDNVSFLYKMDLQGVCLAAGSACASASVKPSHVLTAMGLTEAEAKQSVRFSFGKDNTEEEIIFAAKLVKETVRALRGFQS